MHAAAAAAAWLQASKLATCRHVHSVHLTRSPYPCSLQVRPLVKLTLTTYRVPTDKLLFPLIPKLLNNDDLAIIRWLPDVHQAFITTRRPVSFQ